MKKIMLALSLLIAAVVTFAFTRASDEAGSKTVDVIYKFILTGTPSQTDFENEANWEQISEEEADELDCVGSGSICYMTYLDQVGSDNPPTLPSGFNPYSQLHVERAP